MKKGNHLIFCWVSLFILNTVFSITYSQEKDGVEVVVSSNKVIIEGVVYYVHIVKKGQTLYSISKAYNVPESTIVKENPGADITLKEGQALKIPTKVVYNEVSLDEKDKYIYHIIRPGETLFFLSQKYQVSIAELEKINPEVKYDSLQINQVIKIPRKSPGNVNPQIKVPQDTNYLYYRVKKKETLYSLAKRFNITENQIRDANEDLKFGILKEGQIIRIPRPFELSIQTLPGDTENDTLPALADVKAYSISTNMDSLHALCDSFNYSATTVTFNVALMLPFGTKEKEEIINSEGNEDISDDLKYYQLKKLRLFQDMSNCLSEFYEGSLLAIDALKEQKVNVNLYVYDTQRDSSVVKQIIMKEEFKKMDLVIGPVYCSSIHVLYENLNPGQTNIVSPFCNSLSVPSKNPVFILNPTKEIMVERMAYFMMQQGNERLVIVYSGDPESIKEKDCMVQYFYLNQLPDSTYRTVIYNDTADHFIYPALHKGGKNHIIVLTEDEIYLSKVIAKLNLISSKYDLILYGFPSWNKLMNIDYEFYHQLEFTYATPFQSEFTVAGLNTFQKNYLKYFKSIPYRTTIDGYYYALMGYDIMFYFVTALKEHGRYFQYCLEDISIPQLSSKFSFEMDEQTGYYMNNGVTYNRFTKEFTVIEVEAQDTSSVEKDLSIHTNHP